MPFDPLPAEATDANWWRQAAVYQIYPRSFADADGDGIGDLRGITSRVPYLKALGVDAVWLSPFYPSALADGGYDVDDYRGVDPNLGTLEDFDDLVEALHAAGLKIIVDIVPNHSSNRHAWFQEALASPKGSPARARYIFRDGLGPHGDQPPSDWTSHFGGTAWTRVTEPDGTPGQWYLHLFAKEQPDWNWDNQEVREDFLHTLRFWADRGVDGFRVDVAHALAKDLAEPLRSKPTTDAGLTPADGSDPIFDRDEVHEIYRAWRQLFNEYNPPKMAVAEAWVPAGRRPRYASAEGLGQAFNFDFLVADWDPGQFRRTIMASMAESAKSKATSTWVLSNHDVVRHASRYGLPAGAGVHNGWLLSDGREPSEDRGVGLRRARAATLLMLALPGSAYLYQGEELGLFEVADLSRDVLQDPMWKRSRHRIKGRDGCRVPLPWDTRGRSFGFGQAVAHLPQPHWFGEHAVTAQDGRPDSVLELYRSALALRTKLQAGETMHWEGGEAGSVLHFSRPGGWRCITNFGNAPVRLPDGDLVLASAPLVDGMLPADTSAWVVQ
ncbi:glycoside hydrolase family 13 protein [Arthrobacter sp. AD-310]